MTRTSSPQPCRGGRVRNPSGPGSRRAPASEAVCPSAIHLFVTLVHRACDIAPGTVRRGSGIANGAAARMARSMPVTTGRRPEAAEVAFAQERYTPLTY